MGVAGSHARVARERRRACEAAFPGLALLAISNVELARKQMKITETENCQKRAQNLRQHAVNVAQQKDDCKNTGDANGESVPSTLWTHPKNEPTKHDQENTRKIQLNQVISQTPLQEK